MGAGVIGGVIAGLSGSNIVPAAIGAALKRLGSVPACYLILRGVRSADLPADSGKASAGGAACDRCEKTTICCGAMAALLLGEGGQKR